MWKFIRGSESNATPPPVHPPAARVLKRVRIRKFFGKKFTHIQNIHEGVLRLVSSASEPGAKSAPAHHSIRGNSQRIYLIANGGTINIMVIPSGVLPYLKGTFAIDRCYEKDIGNIINIYDTVTSKIGRKPDFIHWFYMYLVVKCCGYLHTYNW